jgi:DNA-binding transcriptional ArsR family regulator
MAKAPDPFPALADPTRRRILVLLAAGVLSISALVEQFQVSRPAVSKHVKVLEQAGLVRITASGRERLCSLDPKGFTAVHDWLSFFERFWQQRLGKMAGMLDAHARTKARK